MGAQINKVDIPVDVQPLLPPGTLLFGFDGEVQYRYTENNPLQTRSFSLDPVTNNDRMYARRWTATPIQNLILIPIEQFQGHIATVYYLYVPDKDTQRTGQYVVNCFAAFSHTTRQWMWVRHPGAIKIILEGSVDTYFGVAKALVKFTLRGGKEARLRLDAQNAAAIEGIVTYLRRRMDHQFQQDNLSAGRL